MPPRRDDISLLLANLQEVGKRLRSKRAELAALDEELHREAERKRGKLAQEVAELEAQFLPLGAAPTKKARGSSAPMQDPPTIRSEKRREATPLGKEPARGEKRGRCLVALMYLGKPTKAQELFAAAGIPHEGAEGPARNQNFAMVASLAELGLVRITQPGTYLLSAKGALRAKELEPEYGHLVAGRATTSAAAPQDAPPTRGAYGSRTGGVESALLTAGKPLHVEEIAKIAGLEKRPVQLACAYLKTQGRVLADDSAPGYYVHASIRPNAAKLETEAKKAGLNLSVKALQQAGFKVNEPAATQAH